MKKEELLIKRTAGILASVFLLESCDVGTILSDFDQDAKYKTGRPRGKVTVEIGENSPYLQATQKLFDRITANPKEAKLFCEDQESYIRALGFQGDVENLMVKDEGILAVIRLIADERLHNLIKNGNIEDLKIKKELRSFYMETLPQVPNEILEKIKGEVISKPELVKAIKKLIAKDKLRSSDITSVAIDDKDEFSVAIVGLAVVVYGIVYLGAITINWVGAVNAVAVGNIGISINAVYTTNATITTGEDGPKASTSSIASATLPSAWVLAGGGIDSLEAIAKIQRDTEIVHLVDQLSTAYPGSVTTENRDSVIAILDYYVEK